MHTYDKKTCEYLKEERRREELLARSTEAVKCKEGIEDHFYENFGWGSFDPKKTVIKNFI